MKLGIPELNAVLFKIASKYVPEEDAQYYATEIIEAYIRKYPRSNVLKDEVISDTKRQEKYKKHKIKIVKEIPGLVKIDFHNLPMTYSIKWLHDLLIEKSSASGISIAGFDNSGGMHSLHTWVQGLAKRGYFAIGGYNGGPLGVVPLNGTAGLLGTNPIVYGFPTNKGTVVVDMATSQIPYFEIRNRKKLNQKLPDNTAVDSRGLPTNDPYQALSEDGTSNLLPIGGGYKGYAINYLLEIMTGALVGAKLSNEQNPNYVNEDHGGFLIVIDIRAFNQYGVFEDKVTNFNNVIRSQKPADGETVIVPGDNNLKRLAKAMKTNTVEVDNLIWKELKELAG